MALSRVVCDLISFDISIFSLFLVYTRISISKPQTSKRVVEFGRNIVTYTTATFALIFKLFTCRHIYSTVNKCFYSLKFGTSGLT